MASENVHTELLIKETAKTIFFKKGLMNATTQDIADEAGVNRALIHYYFRNREHLFETLLEEALSETRSKFQTIFRSDVPFKKKICQYLDVFIDRDIEFPYIQNFIITEITRHPERRRDFFSRKKNEISKVLVPLLKNEIEKGNIAPIDPEHFIVNMMSMCSYPLVAKPLLQNIFSFDNKAYKSFLKERKRVIYKVLFQEDYKEENLKKD